MIELPTVPFKYSSLNSNEKLSITSVCKAFLLVFVFISWSFGCLEYFDQSFYFTIGLRKERQKLRLSRLMLQQVQLFGFVLLNRRLHGWTLRKFD